MVPEPATGALPSLGRMRRPFAGFPALRHRNFRLFVVGQGISLIGYWMQSVAQGWLVYRLAGRPLDLAKVACAGCSRVFPRSGTGTSASSCWGRASR